MSNTQDQVPASTVTFGARSRATSRIPQSGHGSASSHPSNGPSSLIQNGLPTPTEGQSVTSRAHDSDESDSSGLRSVVYSNTPLNNDEDDHHGGPSTTSAAVPHSSSNLHDSDHVNVSRVKTGATTAVPREDNDSGKLLHIPPYIPVLLPNAANRDRPASKTSPPAGTTNANQGAELKGLGITFQGDNDAKSSHSRASVWTATNDGRSALEPASTTGVYGAAVREWKNIPIKRELIDDDDYDDDDSDSTLTDLPEYMYEIPAHHTLLKAAANDIDSNPNTGGLASSFNSTEQAQQGWFGRHIKAEPVDYGYGSPSPIMRESMDKIPTHRALIKAAPSDDEYESEHGSPTCDIKTAAQAEQDDGDAPASNEQSETTHETHAHRTVSPTATSNDEATTQPDTGTCVTDEAGRAARDNNGPSLSEKPHEVETLSVNTTGSEPAAEPTISVEQDKHTMSTMHESRAATELPQDIVGSSLSTSTAVSDLARESVHAEEQNDRAMSTLHEPPQVVELPRNTPALALPADTAVPGPARTAFGPVEQNDHLRPTVSDCLQVSELVRNTAYPEQPASEASPKLVNASTAARRKHAFRGNADPIDGPVACHNCGTTITRSWRRDDDGHTICNACGLYYRKYSVHRSLKMKKKKSADEQVETAEPATKKRGRKSRAATEFATKSPPSHAPKKRGRPPKLVFSSPTGPIEQNNRQTSRDHNPHEVVELSRNTSGPCEPNDRRRSTSYGWHNETRDTWAERATIHDACNNFGVTSQSTSPNVAADTAGSELTRDIAVPTPVTDTGVEPSPTETLSLSSETPNFPRAHTAAPCVRTSSAASPINLLRMPNTVGSSGHANTSGTALGMHNVDPASNTNPASPYLIATTASSALTTNTPGSAHAVNTPDCSISLDITSGTARIVNHTAPGLTHQTHTNQTGHPSNTADRNYSPRTTGPAHVINPSCPAERDCHSSSVGDESYAMEHRDDDDCVITNTAGPAHVANAVSPAGRNRLGSSSLQAYTYWLETVLSIPGQGLPDKLQYKLGYEDTLDVRSAPYMPRLPPGWPALLEVYFTSVKALFPIVEIADKASIISRAERLDINGRTDTHDPTTTAVVYGCLAIGAQHSGDIQVGRRYLSAALSIVGLVMASSTQKSVQALLILVLGLRAQNKNGAAYRVLRNAIHTLQALGAHDRPSQARPNGSLEMERRLWWTAYCLERMMSIESGRPSHIHDADIDQGELRQPGLLQLGSESLCLLVAAQLARIQGHVSSKLYPRREASPSPREILSIISELDEELTQWMNGLPANLRPDNEVLTGDSSIRAVQCYLALQYHSTLATVHRSALLMSHATHLAVIENSPEITRFAPRLRSSEKICVASARRIISTFHDARDEGVLTPLNNLTQLLPAIYILAVHTLRNPSGSRARNDLNDLWQAGMALTAARDEIGQRSDTLLPLLLRLGRKPGLAVVDRLSAAPRPQVQQHYQHQHQWQQQQQPFQQQPQQHRPQQTIDLTSDAPASSTDSHTKIWKTLFPLLFQGKMHIDPGYRPSDAEVRGWLGIPELTEQELRLLHAVQ
ncbi:hypothetical protein MBLNU457_6112t1 [Dothideomycetes sp. NU457]